MSGGISTRAVLAACLLACSLSPPAALARPADATVAAVTAADDARMAAMQTADGAALEAIFSDDLRYAHSNGVVDTKGSFIDLIASGKTKYHSFRYEDRSVSTPAPGIALVSGRVRMKVSSATGEIDSLFSILAVWREEQGRWRFLAWQSARLPPPKP